MRWYGWLTIAFIIWWITEDPQGAAHAVHDIVHFFDVAFTGVAHFIGQVTGHPQDAPS